MESRRPGPPASPRFPPADSAPQNQRPPIANRRPDASLDADLARPHAPQRRSIADGQPREQTIRARLQSRSPERERQVEADLEVVRVELRGHREERERGRPTLAVTESSTAVEQGADRFGSTTALELEAREGQPELDVAWDPVDGISKYTDRMVAEAPLRITIGRAPIARCRCAEIALLREELGQLVVEIGIGGLAGQDFAVERDGLSPFPAASPARRLGGAIEEFPSVVGSLERQHRGRGSQAPPP